MIRKSYTFEPGDNLTKIANQDLEIKSSFDAQEKMRKLILESLESVGKSRDSLKADVTLLPLNSSNFGEKWESITKVNFDGMIRLYPKKTQKDKFVPSMSIPFMIRNGGLLPIDTATFLGRNFAFSKKFLNQAALAMLALSENPYVINNETAFHGLDDFISKNTDTGNIRDVLQIRNQDSGANGFMGSAPIKMACEAVDAFLEKTSSIEPITNLKNTIRKTAFEIADRLCQEAIEKNASLTEEVGAKIMESANIFTNLKAMPWKKISEVADSTVVQIVDVNPEAEKLHFKDAVVFKNIYDLTGFNWKTKKSFGVNQVKGSVVIDEDSNYKVLRDTTDIAKKYLVAETKGDFKIKGRTLKNYMTEVLRTEDEDVLCFLKLKDGLMGPVSIRHTFSPDRINFTYSPSDQERPHAGKTANCAVYIRSIREAGEDTSDYANFILTKQTEDFKEISADERESILGNLFESQKDIMGLLSHASLIRDDILIIPVKKFIRTPIESMTDIIFGYKSTDKPLEKSASEDTVFIEKPIPSVAKYNVTLKRGMFKKHSFSALDVSEVMALLKSVTIPQDEVVSMIGFLDSGERQISRNIPFDLSNIDGSTADQKASDIVAGFMKDMFGKKQQQELLKEVLSTQVGEILLKSPEMVVRGADMLTSLASDAEALADKFEKLAMDHKSTDFRDIAKLMVATARVDRLMEKVATHAVEYDLRTEKELLKKTVPLIEKSAGMLYDLKKDQMKGVELVNQNTISQTFRTLSRLNVYAQM